MSNLFKGARFGDKFVTRDGNMVIYIKSIDGGHRLLSQQFPSGYTVLPNGRFFGDSKREYDIVDRWQDPIGEDELDRLAQESYPSDYSSSLYYDHETDINIELREAFKKGYRKAKEE